MAKKKAQQGHFIGPIEDFTAQSFSAQGERVEVKPTGLYATWDWNKVYLHYTGDDAQAAHILMELPKDPVVLKAIAKGLSALAKKLAEE